MIPLFVPATDLREATRLYLHTMALEPGQIDPVVVDVSASPWAYNTHLADRWREGRGFVNMEHDIVPWPGAITAMWRCPEPWCAYGYLPDLNMNGASMLGLTKFAAPVIAALPDVWTDMRATYDADPRMDDYTRWATCDMWFTDYALKRGLACHQHTPAVFNANPNIERHTKTPPRHIAAGQDAPVPLTREQVIARLHGAAE